MVLSYKSSYCAAFFTANKDLKEIELKNTRYKPIRLILDYIYLADLTLMDIEGFDDELIDTYKLAKKYGLVKLQEEIKNRLHNKLKGITIDESKDGKKKCKAMSVIESLSELAKKYEGIIKDKITEEHKLIMLPTGTALIIDATKYNALLEDVIIVELP